MRVVNASNMQNSNKPSKPCDSKYRLLCKIREYDFAIVETSMFLDTHPNNMKALNYYTKLRKEREVLVKEYEAHYGPLTIYGNMSEKKWDWIVGPWPWEGEN